MNTPLELLDIPGLDELLASVDQRLVQTCSVGAPELSAASLRVVSTGGKRLRPALTIAAARLGGVFDAQVVAAATAVELIQVGSLVHDDIFDEAQTRRGTPTINAVEGPNEALFSGTFLLARAGVEGASAGKLVATELARTVAKLCVGQVSESRHLFDVDQAMDSYLSTIERKTAALFACSCRVGALTGSLPEDHVLSLGEFGRNFGMAFQIIDDVLDLIGDPDALGKPVGTDIGNGVLTLPTLLELAETHGGDLRALLVRRESSDLEQAARMIRQSPRMDEAIDIAREYAEAASDAIAEVAGSTSALSRFPHSYLDWALERFVAA